MILPHESGLPRPRRLLPARPLDRLGLPQGEIAHSDSKRLVDATALRAGRR
jgi:hypothetical protein